ncbi:hypothetical protein EGN63_02040 [Klebsiella pneumoniae]|nr:hypothetical protein EGN63_02040 [Klebsiella pneumoniae]
MAANALPDLHFLAICSLGQRSRKTKPATGNTTQSRRPAQAQRRRARTAGAEPLLCRVAANALPDLRLCSICRSVECFRKKTKPATGNMTRY